VTGSTLSLVNVAGGAATVLTSTQVSVPQTFSVTIDAAGDDFTCRVGTAVLTGHVAPPAGYPQGQFTVSVVGHVVLIRTLEEWVQS
jgi:hypothetical protein